MYTIHTIHCACVKFVQFVQFVCFQIVNFACVQLLRTMHHFYTVVQCCYVVLVRAAVTAVLDIESESFACSTDNRMYVVWTS